MHDMTMIGAVDSNWAIGYRKDMLIHLPADLKRFRELTTGNVLIIGRKTLESFPEGKPLKNRVNIVLTSDKDYYVPGIIRVNSIEEAVSRAGEIALKNSLKIFVAGGGQIYSQLEKHCNKALITYIYYKFEHSDTFFPPLNDIPDWKLTSVSEKQQFNDISFEYRVYKRKSQNGY